jgi:hypothetical protein
MQNTGPYNVNANIQGSLIGRSPSANWRRLAVQVAAALGAVTREMSFIEHLEELRRRLILVGVCLFACAFAACSGTPPPAQPSPAPIAAVFLEAEAGRGDGQIVERSRASGGQTVHLGPGEQRQWPFAVNAAEARYDLSLTYSNGKGWQNEVISVSLDGTAVATFQNRDSADTDDAWNVFVTDPAGRSMLGRGNHTLTLGVAGGDGCVEIDIVTLSPAPM